MTDCLMTARALAGMLIETKRFLFNSDISQTRKTLIYGTRRYTMISYAMTSQEFIELEDRYGAHNYAPLDIVLSRGQGVWVYDVEGRRYLDCLSAYSALNQGHCHPRLVQALVEQASKLT